MGTDNDTPGQSAGAQPAAEDARERNLAAINQVAERLAIPPSIEERLARVTVHLREARAELEQAYEQAEVATDAESRCKDALQKIDGALSMVEWGKPR